MRKKDGPRILTLDIENWAYVVKSWDVGRDTVNQQDRIIKDRAIASVAAKWSDEKEVMFFSTRGQRDPRNDKKVVKAIHKLISKADIIITQNGTRHDIPIIKGRSGVYGLGSFGKPKHYDTCVMARQLGLPSTRLDYLTRTFAPHLRKLDHRKFPGNELWDECEEGNPEAWDEMEKYNKQDVLGTEAVFFAIAPQFDIDFSVYYDGTNRVCSCGSTEWYMNGFAYTPKGKFRRYKCKNCGSNKTDEGQANNLLSEEKRASLRRVK